VREEFERIGIADKYTPLARTVHSGHGLKFVAQSSFSAQ
jgi:hypothetical protein